MSSTQEKTAIIVGATGLVGSHILREILSDERYSKVIVFHRRSTEVSHPKLIEHIIKFDELRIWKHLIKGDELYSALGTTIKQAGSKNAQYCIDFDHQLDIAVAAAENGVAGLALVSSAGASARSENFYLNMKGRLDKEIRKLPFKKIVIVRPSVLKGTRPEERFLEKLGIQILSRAYILPGLRKYRPIHASNVAKAMIYALNSSSEQVIYENSDLFSLPQN